jgi:hypothetical protein
MSHPVSLRWLVPIGLWVAGYSGPHSSPEATTRAMMEASERGDLAAYKASLVPTAREKVTSAGPPASPSGSTTGAYTLGRPSVDGDSAGVLVRFAPGPDGEVGEMTVYLRKTGGEWLAYALGLGKGDGSQSDIDPEHPETALLQILAEGLKSQAKKDDPGGTGRP